MNEERLLKILLAPHVSEKASRIADGHKQFVFRVLPEANKQEIKSAVEQMFGVQVEHVQVVNAGQGAPRRRHSRTTLSFKKACVAWRQASHRFHGAAVRSRLETD